MGFCLKCGKIDKTLINPIIPILIMLFENCFFQDPLDNLYTHKTLFNSLQSISKILVIIPFLIFKLTNKPLNNQEKVFNKLHSKEYTENYNSNKFKKYAFILLINILNLIFKMNYYGLIIKIKETLSWYIVDIIFITLFAYFILKSPLYKHQYLSITMIVCSGLILNAIHGIFAELGFIDIILNIFGDAVYSLMIVLKRYSMECLFCSPYEIVFYEGVISFIFFSILLTVFTSVDVSEENKNCRIHYNEKCYIDNFFEYIELLKTNKKEILILIFVLIYYIPYYQFFNITIKINSVYHVLLILLAEEELFFIYPDDTFVIIMNIILTIIILFMFMVFVELIELNFCGFSNNLKRAIALRAQSEMQNIETESPTKTRKLSAISLDGQIIELTEVNNN